MRRNVRRLNREIGHHAAALSNPTAVIPLSVPTSYQPRKPYEKKSAISAAVAAQASVNMDYIDSDSMLGANGYETLGENTTTGSTTKSKKSSLKSADGTKKKGVRKAVNLAGKYVFG